MTIIVLLPYAVSAQQRLPSFAPTPTAASIARFGDVPVSPFTGLPSISIPLYSFNVVGLELPLRLDYDASSVQMNVLPGWVGHNWSLAANGITTYYDYGRMGVLNLIKDDNFNTIKQFQLNYRLK